MKKVLVVGAGFMGSGITQVSAQSGYLVHLIDIQQEVTGKAIKEIKRSLERMVAQGHLGRKAGKGFYRYSPEGKRLSPGG
ncbi:MAG: 3-hydroxyacyl-CoA dehydrogenase NAD-binding domain-containing protein [Thermodesulfobacteriota bacterium]